MRRSVAEDVHDVAVKVVVPVQTEVIPAGPHEQRDVVIVNVPRLPFAVPVAPTADVPVAPTADVPLWPISDVPVAPTPESPTPASLWLAAVLPPQALTAASVAARRPSANNLMSRSLAYC